MIPQRKICGFRKKKKKASVINNNSKAIHRSLVCLFICFASVSCPLMIMAVNNLLFLVYLSTVCTYTKLSAPRSNINPHKVVVKMPWITSLEIQLNFFLIMYIRYFSFLFVILSITVLFLTILFHCAYLFH